MSTQINLDGEHFIPAILVGGIESALESQDFVIKKRIWQHDKEVQTCPMCKAKFTSIRRRHHCRQCGKVICNKCCSTKLCLPQFSVTEAERICDKCYRVASSVKKARSQQLKDQLESAKELAEMCKTHENISLLFQFGGFHTLLSFAATHPDNVMLMKAVMAGLHTLVTFQPLQEYMVECHLIDAVCQILEKSTNKKEEQLLLESISALVLLCKNKEYLTKVISIDGMYLILDLCQTGSETVVLMALRALSLMIAHPDSEKIILDGERPALKSLLNLAASSIEQVQATALQSLVCLSVGSDWVKHRLVQEDFTAGRPLKTAIQSKTSIEVQIYAAAIVANVATCPENLSALAEPVDCMIEILYSDQTSEDLLSQVSRGLANFAKLTENLYKMKPVLPALLQKCVTHSNKQVSSHGLRFALNLLCHQPTLIGEDAFRGSSGLVLQSLLQISGVMESTFKVLLQHAPDVTKPFSASSGLVLQSLLQISGVMKSTFKVLLQHAPDVTKPFL